VSCGIWVFPDDSETLQNLKVGAFISIATASGDNPYDVYTRYINIPPPMPMPDVIHTDIHESATEILEG
jgi:hypothetical protein